MKMKKMILLIALSTFINADVTCIKIGQGMTICTDDETGQETTIWTY